MGTRVGGWLAERWPFRAVWRAVITEDIPGGSSYFYSLGSSVLFVFIIQAVTGVFQLFFYSPTVDHAYDSVSYLRTQVPFGWLIHGLHYWGAQAMVVLVGLHLSRVFIWGAQKKPREFTWLIGVCLLLFTLAMSFTGAGLPWDVKGYWATEVGTSITGTVPLIGDFVQRLVRGAEGMGQLALDRLFTMHIAVLPGMLALLILVHLVAFRRFGSVGPWNPKKRTRSGPFWPDQLLKDAVLASGILILLLALTVWAAAPITGPADPTDLSVQPKPEWNFLFLYQAIKAFKGPLEPVGTVLLPAAAVVFLFLVPFLSKKEERNPLRRLWGLGVFAACAAAVIALTISGAWSNPGGASAVRSTPPAAQAALTRPAASGAQKPAGPQAVNEGASLLKSQGCIACHKVDGVGGSVGPDLSDEGNGKRSASWLAAQITNPKAHNPQTAMPAFATRLGPSQVKALTDYLLSLKSGSKTSPISAPSEAAPASAPPPPGTSPPPSSERDLPGPAASMIGDAKHGAILFNQTCQRCHGPQGTDKVPNPGSDDGTVPPLNPIDPALKSEDPKVFALNIDRLLQHGSRPSGPNPAVSMLPFGDSSMLTQQAIANLEAYVLALNHVDRARIMRPGLSPVVFFLAAVLCFAAAGGVLGLLVSMRRKRPRPPRTRA